MQQLRAPFTTLCLLVIVSLTFVGAATADGISGGQVYGPVSADVLRIVDGDTILVAARPWPQQTVEVFVRLRGIDTPEMNAACPEARTAARAARDWLGGRLVEGDSLLLTNVSGDKYFGRVVADVHLTDGSNPAQEMLAAGLAAPYGGGAKRPGPCSDRSS